MSEERPYIVGVTPIDNSVYECVVSEGRLVTANECCELLNDSLYQCKTLKARVAALTEAAKEYSYNEHFPTCKISNPSISRCNCGYSELAALIQESE